MDAAVARRMWTLYEPVHVVTYFGPDVADAWAAVGVTGFWRTYFAGRAAPLGACSAEVVTATFFGFAPAFVARAVPSVWSLVTPTDALTARSAGAVTALDATVPTVGPDEEVAAGLLRRAARAATGEGRALFAANASLPWPADTDVRAVLWHAATLLREHRGDAHVAALVAADLTGLEANVLAVAGDRVEGPWMRRVRGWTEDEWADAAARLTDRGLLAGDDLDAPTLTDAGQDLCAEVEGATDRAALRPWAVLGDRDTDRLASLLAPMARSVWDSGILPAGNPIGLPRPD